MAQRPAPKAAPMAAPAYVPITPTTQVVTGNTWPIPGDAPDLAAICRVGAATIKDQEVLIDAYQQVLNGVQAAPQPLPAAIGTGTANPAPNDTQLVVTVAYNSIVVGSMLTDGAAIPAGTTIVSQQSGTPGGTGVYVTSNPTTANATLITFTPPPPKMPWPTQTDSPTLQAISQSQTAIIRSQNALIQQYQDLLNTAAVTPPATGP